MNSTFTNTILVIILVLLVGFGVWYFTGNSAQTEDTSGPGFEINVQGGSDGGAPN